MRNRLQFCERGIMKNGQGGLDVEAVLIELGAEKAGIEEAAGLDVAEGVEQGGFQVRVLLLEFLENGPKRTADGSGLQRAAARDHGR